MTDLLCAKDIGICFGAVRALAGASLTLRSGEVHALMGENGAGKSTLIKVLTGVYAADCGEILLKGQRIRPASPRAAESLGISTVYQEVNLIPGLSVADNILLGRQPVRFGFLRKKKMYEIARQALNRVGVEIDVTQPLGNCSMAIQQLVAIARALDVKAQVLILDEPTSSLDAAEVEFLFGILRQLRAEGLGILLVTHFLDQVYALSDRITVFRNGQTVGEFLTPELPRMKLISAMIGRDPEELPAEAREAETREALKRPVALSARQLSRPGHMQPIDLDIHEGEVLGLAGLLGSGRTETAKMLFGAVPAVSGEIKINGVAAQIHAPRQAIRQRLAFCTEDRRHEGIVPNLSVRENLILAMQASRNPLKLIPRVEQETLAAHYIQTLNIKTPSVETPIRNLSGGNQQKVLLARWLALQPQIIILDEPTRGIDVGAKGEIEKLVRSFRERGLAVLYISSELEELSRNCERVAVLRDRRKVSELAGADVQPARIMQVIADVHA